MEPSRLRHSCLLGRRQARSEVLDMIWEGKLFTSLWSCFRSLYISVVTETGDTRSSPRHAMLCLRVGLVSKSSKIALTAIQCASLSKLTWTEKIGKSGKVVSKICSASMEPNERDPWPLLPWPRKSWKKNWMIPKSTPCNSHQERRTVNLSRIKNMWWRSLIEWQLRKKHQYNRLLILSPNSTKSLLNLPLWFWGLSCFSKLD